MRFSAPAIYTRRAPKDFGTVERVAYGIGAQKAGTTWLYEQLKAHPDVHVSWRKEVHYWDTVFFPHLPYYRRLADEELARFGNVPIPRQLWRGLRPKARRWGRQLDLYRRMFEETEGARGYQRFVMDNWKGERLVADISPGYAMLEPKGFAAMLALKPDSRFVFIMREPVSRLWSGMRHHRARGHMKGGKAADLNAAFRWALDHPERGAFMMTDYARTIRNLEAVVPPEKIGYFFFETLFEEAEMARLADLLGIAPIRADFGEQVNPGSAAEERLDPGLAALARERLAETYKMAEAKFGDRLPKAWRETPRTRQLGRIA